MTAAKLLPSAGLFPLFVDRAAAQGGIVLEPLDALLLQLLVLRGEITGSRLAFLGSLGAFQNNLFAHGIKWVEWSWKAYRPSLRGQAASLPFESGESRHAPAEKACLFPRLLTKLCACHPGVFRGLRPKSPSANRRARPFLRQPQKRVSGALSSSM